MDNKQIIERLEKQNANIEKIADILGKQLVDIGILRAENKRIIAEIQGKSYLNLGETSYNTATELLNNGFITTDEINTNGIKGLITWIDKDIKKHLRRTEFNQVVKNVVIANKHGKVNDKIPYLKKSLKRAVEDKEKATDPN